MAKDFRTQMMASDDRLEQLSQKYDPRTGTLTIYDGAKKIWRGRANLGDYYSVVYDGKTYKVSRQHLPHRKNHLLMWMFGFPKDNRFDSDENFTRFLEWHREKNKFPGYTEYIYSGVGYAFAVFTTAEDLQPERICAWVDPTIDRKLAKEILSIKSLNIAAMEDFAGEATGQLLFHYFGFRKHDFDEVNHNLLS